LSSIKRHTRYKDFNVVVVSRNFDDEGFDVVAKYDFVRICEINIDIESNVSSRVHGTMLDDVWPEIQSELILTLDSDCFPVANGWLEGLVEMIDNGADVAGILHPWAPPPGDMKHTKIEWRVRNQHCWNVTHVACQLVKKSFLEKHNLKYNDGDDTGLSIPMRVLSEGGKVDGYRITRCPKPIAKENANKNNHGGLIDPEFNRYVCLIFGDKVYHQGGYTRKAKFGDEPLMEDSFGWAMKKVVEDGSADFLMEYRFSYVFGFDREDEVAAEKMQRLFGLKSQRMKG